METKTRVREMVSGIWVIDEIVISGKHWASGSYITWDNRFASKEKALMHLEQGKSNSFKGQASNVN